MVLEKYEGQNEARRVDEFSCLATASIPFSLRNRQTPLRIYRYRVDTKPMADFLASPGFVACAAGAAQRSSAIVYSPSLELVKEKLALWRVWSLEELTSNGVTDPRKLGGNNEYRECY